MNDKMGVALLLAIIFLALAVLIFRTPIEAEKVRVPMVKNLPYSGLVDGVRAVVWDTKGCLWRDKRTNEIIPDFVDDKGLELSQVCYAEAHAKRPTVEFQEEREENN